jgi:hypothetical protein
MARGDSTLQSGIYLLPFVGFFVTTILASGNFLARTGLYMPCYLVGGLLTTIGGALLYTIDLDSPARLTYGYSIILAVGSGAYSHVAYSVAQAKSPKSLLPQAVSFIICGQMLGITLALSISNSIFLNLATNRIAVILPDEPRERVQATISGFNGALVESLPDDVRDRVLEAIAWAVSNTYIMVVTAGCVVTVLSLFMKRERLFQVESAGA